MSTNWSSSDKAAAVILSNVNLTAVTGAVGLACVRGTTSKAPNSGHWYYEATQPVAGAQSDDCVGVAAASASLTNFPNGGNTTGSVGGAAYYARQTSNNVSVNGSQQIGSLGSLAANGVACIALDMNNLRIWFRINNGFWNGSSAANPAANRGGFDISGVFASVAAFPICGFQGDAPSCKWVANFGASPFAFTPPSDFQAWDPQIVGLNLNQSVLMY